MSSSSVVRSVVLSAFLGATVLAGRTIAQTTPICQPPKVGEYLMMVVNPTEAVQTQLQQVLPAPSSAIVCTYLQDRVLRVDGFADIDTANSWAQYVTDQGEFQAFVARPPVASAATPPIAAPPATVPSFPSPTATPSGSPSIAAAPALPPIAPAVPSFPQPSELPPAAPAPTAPPAAAPATPPVPSPSATTPPAAQTIAYNPQLLEAGYAVLVDYANRPEVAAAVRQLLARDIGLVSYAQRPYLLAAYTTDPAVANSILQTLSSGNFAAMIVDSRSAILLTRSVRSGQ